jgi:hypothetical protein
MAAFAYAANDGITNASPSPRSTSSSWVSGRPWTHSEADELRDAASSQTIPTIAKTLGRSEASVRLKLRNLGYDFRDLAGFKVKDLAGMLGVTIRQVRRWRQKGYLRGINGRITEESFAKFCRIHAEKIPYDRLGWDTQLWLRSFGYRQQVPRGVAITPPIYEVSCPALSPPLAQTGRSTASNT